MPKCPVPHLRQFTSLITIRPGGITCPSFAATPPGQRELRRRRQHRATAIVEAISSPLVQPVDTVFGFILYAADCFIREVSFRNSQTWSSQLSRSVRRRLVFEGLTKYRRLFMAAYRDRSPGKFSTNTFAAGRPYPGHAPGLQAAQEANGGCKPPSDKGEVGWKLHKNLVGLLRSGGISWWMKTYEVLA